MDLFGKRKIRLDDLEGKSVVQGWLSKCSLMQQTVVLTAIRGCDGVGKHDPTKAIVRQLRQHVLINAGGEGSSYMVVENLMESIKGYFEDCDQYPLHFSMHLAHAAEIIGYKHPDKAVADLWGKFYYDFCHTIHLTPESEKEMDERLCDGRDESRHGSEYNLIPEWIKHNSTYVQELQEEIKSLQRDKAQLNMLVSQKSAQEEAKTVYHSGRVES